MKMAVCASTVHWWFAGAEHWTWGGGWCGGCAKNLVCGGVAVSGTVSVHR